MKLYAKIVLEGATNSIEFEVIGVMIDTRSVDIIRKNQSPKGSIITFFFEESIVSLAIEKAGDNPEEQFLDPDTWVYIIVLKADRWKEFASNYLKEAGVLCS